MNYSNLLQKKGFILNTYPEGKFWELVITKDENKKSIFVKYLKQILNCLILIQQILIRLYYSVQKILQNVFSIMIVTHLIWILKHL